MKKILISDYNIPIDYIFEDVKRNATQIKEFTKEVNIFVKKVMNLKDKYAEREVLVNFDDNHFKEIYCGKNEDNLYFKYDRKFYEDNNKTTRLIYVDDNENYQALIKDKKSNKMFVVENDTRSCHIYFYENDNLKRSVAVSLYGERKELFEKEIKNISGFYNLGFNSKIKKMCSNKLNFRSENSIVKSIEKALVKKSYYEIIFNKEKSDLERLTLLNGKVKNFTLTSAAIDKLTPNLKEKMKDKNEKIFEEIANYLKEKEEMAFLSDDKVIVYTDLKTVLNKVKNIINEKQNCFFNYNHQAFKTIDVVAEDIFGKSFNLNKEEENEYEEREIKYKGLILTDYEGYDYKKLTYEEFNFENISIIYDAITKELELSGHDECESIE